MDLSIDRVLQLSPDAASASAGKKLATPKSWGNLGRSSTAMWGECQGSALYQTRISLADISYKCSCPSRKFPCKHVLGLLLLAAGNAAAVPTGEAPQWVAEWLAKKAASPKQQARAEKGAPVDAAAQAKRAEKRLSRVAEGIEQLELWMSDLVRSGLAGLENQGATFWEAQAARLVDAQAPGLAGRLRRMSTIPGSSADWPARVADHLGRLTLLTHAFGRLDALEPPLQHDLRQAIGWTVSQDELDSGAEVVRDQWLLAAQLHEDDDRVRVQRNWLFGTMTGRSALLLQFSPGNAPFPDVFVPGSSIDAELAYYPSAYPQRARVVARHDLKTTEVARLPGHDSCESLLDEVAGALCKQPWLERFPCMLRQVTPQMADRRWHVRDATGEALPLEGGAHWKLQGLSGGKPLDVAGEWDGNAVLALAAVAEGRYHVL